MIVRPKARQLKHVPELEMLRAIRAFREDLEGGNLRAPFPYERLGDRFPWKVLYRKMEQMDEKGCLEYGVSLSTGWLTDKGKARLRELEDGAKHEIKIEEQGT